MKTNKKVLSLFFAVVLTLSVLVVPSSAKTIAELDAEIKANENKLQQLEGQKDSAKTYITTLREQNSVINSQIKILENEMAPVRARIIELNKEIAECDAKIATLENDIARIDKEIKEQNANIESTYTLLKKRLKAVYMAGETSELEVFLGATDFQDFLTRSEFLRQVSKHDTKVVNELRMNIKALEENVESLKASKDELSESRAKVSADRTENQAKMQKLKENEVVLNNKIASVESNIRKQNDLIYSIDKNSEFLSKENERIEREKEELSALLDKEMSENGTKGDGSVDNGEVNHSFRLSSKGLIHPLQDGNIVCSSPYGSSRGGGRFHAGIDFTCMKNRVVNGVSYNTSKTAPLYASFSGTVKMSKYYGGYGNCVLIENKNGLSFLCAHMDKRYVSVGDYVKQGQVIGTVGNSGHCIPGPTTSNPVAGSHLHFEIRVNGKTVNPAPYLP